MKSFQERNPFVVGAVGMGLTVAAIVLALNYDRLPLVNASSEYSAYFAEAGGLRTDSAVQVSGANVGRVETVALDGPRVLVRFSIKGDIRLGDRTEAAVKAASLLGSKILEITPRGDHPQNGPIPIERTRPAYQLPDALGDLSATISGLDTGQLSDSLAVVAETFKDTPPDLKIAIDGVQRFSQTLNTRDQQLRNLLANANAVTGVLAEHADQVVSLIADTNGLLLQLRSQSAALDHISGNISALAEQIKGFIAENHATLKPALEKLNGVLTIVDNHKDKVRQSIKLLNSYAMSLGEAVGSGPFFKAYIANLLPGQFLQPFIDAAFSDLGLDPNVLLPSARTDPQIGQPATPNLPLPLPRTGQGGDPNLNLPDAITGNPGDPRYPYREPLPAPPPGGPPPGPPAPTPPSLQVDVPSPPLSLAPGPPPGPLSGDGQ